MAQIQTFAPRSSTTKLSPRPYYDPAARFRSNRGPLNIDDMCLLQERMAWENLVTCHMPKPYCTRPSDKYNQAPWIEMPSEGKRFQRVATLPVAGNFTGLDLALSFQGVQGTLFECDPGYDGVIDSVVLQIASPGNTNFVQGSGTITWRIGVDVGQVPNTSAWYFRDFGNVTTTLGSLDTPYYLIGSGLRIVSRQLITIWTNLAVAGDGIINVNATIIGVIGGWTYPR